jgi:hypothetical protein
MARGAVHPLSLTLRPRRTARRAALAAALAALAGAAVPRAARGEEGDRGASPAARALDEARREAVRRGCAWLARGQQTDGAFGAQKGVLAITALSTLALMADGSGVGRGPFGTEVKRGVEYLLKAVETRDPKRPDGYFHVQGDDTSRMHGQGYAMLALATALGSADTRTAVRIRSALRRAVACAEASQTGTGGWGYEPDPAGDHEGSVTVTVAQGLRAARDAGILVSAEVVRRGLFYLRKSQRLETPGEDDDGSFKYSLTNDRSSYALTAAAVSSFFLFGEYPDARDPDQRLRRGVRFLQRALPEHLRKLDWFFYGNFYAAWAAWQLDGAAPAGPDAFWPAWHRRVYGALVGYPTSFRSVSQRADGSWHDEHDVFSFGAFLPTAFAVLTLAIPDEQIPIFQR